MHHDKQELIKLIENPKLWTTIAERTLIEIGVINETRGTKGPKVLSTSSPYWPGTDLHCTKCNNTSTFSCQTASFQNHTGIKTSGRNPSPHWTEDYLLLVSYLCQRCEAYRRHFCFSARHINGEVRVYKFAAWPAQRPKGNSAVKDILDTEKADIFRRGMMCEQHGLGMGAHAYYRRIVETSIAEWLDELKAATGEESHQEWLDSHDGRPQMKAQIDRLQHFMHDSIAGDGKTPINALYSTLSEGLHSLSDEDCLVLAEVLRELLVSTLIKISEMRDKGDLIQDAQDKLNKLKSKLANPQQQSKG